MTYFMVILIHVFLLIGDNQQIVKIKNCSVELSEHEGK